ncbi:sigma 54-interacting transcriptional regulator [Desulfobacula sp.]
MGSTSLSKRLILIIAAIVIVSGIVISLVVTHRYRTSLFQVAIAQSENIAHSLALEAAESILINDRVALQKLLDYQKKSNPAVAYLFIVNNHQVLAHTFKEILPADLIAANQPKDGIHGRIEKIISTKGEKYLDVAWPIFEGKAGVLRLGIFEKPYLEQAFTLWYQMNLIVIGILIISLVVAHLFIKRITSPLKELTRTVEKINNGDDQVRIIPTGKDEVGLLAVSFSNMLKRISDNTRKLKAYSSRLKDKNIELARAHRQTRTSFEIVKETGALLRLDEILSYLIQKLEDIVTCRQILMLVFNGSRDSLFIHSENRMFDFKGENIGRLQAYLDALKHHGFTEKSDFPLKLMEFDGARKIVSFPLRHGAELLGALCIACPSGCQCVTKELEVIELILNQTASSIVRAVAHGDAIRDLQEKAGLTTGFSGIIGKDSQMQIIYKLIKDICVSDATVLIQGESGTGKELVARAIHDNSPRKDNPFMVINCSAYPATLLESELFGYEKGSFTGADKKKPGRFELADGGTVFLDEIGEIDLSAQVKLLRVLQAKRIERIGSSHTLDIDVRILAATNKVLLDQVKTGQFREDLYYRLNVIPINLPPLRTRRNDIPLLARHFLNDFATQENKKIQRFTSNAMRALLGYAWPGNVRELKNSVEHAVVLAKDEQIYFSDLPLSLRQKEGKASGIRLKDIERQHLIEALEACNWNKKAAADNLGIGRSTLYVKLKKYHIASPSQGSSQSL